MFSIYATCGVGCSYDFFMSRVAYYVAFGPHGPRAAVNPPGTALKLFLGTGALIGASGLLFFLARSVGMYHKLFIFILFRLLTDCLPA